MLVRSIRFRAAGLALALVLLLGLTVQTASAGLGFWSKLDLGGIRVTALDVDPNQPNVLFAGTSGQGVYRSMDGGLNWASVNVGLGNLFINSILIEEGSTNNILVAAGREGDPGAGVYRSTNRGVSWTQVLKTSVTQDLVADPNNTAVVYAVGTPTILKSIDGGVNWVLAYTPGTAVSRIVGYGAAVDPLDPNVILLVGNTEDAWDGQVFRTTDGGATWVRTLAGMGDMWDITFAKTSRGLVALFSGEDGIFRSTDTGLTWVRTFGSKVPITVRRVVPNPLNHDFIAAASDAGVFQSTDTGLTWRSLDGTLGNDDVFDVAYDRAAPQTLYAGTDDGAWAFTFR